jgi:hypothetical protein
MWTCKKCNSEVEDDFEICWNCMSDKKGNPNSIIADPILFSEPKSINQHQNIAADSNKKANLNQSDFKVRLWNIKEAGKAIKSIVATIIINLLIMIFLIIVSQSTMDFGIKFGMIVTMGISNLITCFLVLKKLYHVGDLLENT